MKKDVLKEKIIRAAGLREAVSGDPETDCFRVFNAEGDGFDGLTIDYYAGYLLVQFFNEAAEKNLKIIQECAEDAAGGMPFPVRGIVLKNRMTVSGQEDFEELRKSTPVWGDFPDEEIEVRQNGVRAYANLVKGQNTGVFLDMREVRQKLAPLYGNSGVDRMLNLFCYTGMFSVHALAGGLKGAVNVDLSKAVLRRARKNYMLNGFSVDERDFVYGDALEWINIFVRKKKHFDFIVFDPPTFARNRKRQFSVKRDYPGTLRKLESLAPEGYVLTSINSYSVTEKEYISFHPAHWDLLMFCNESSDFVHRGNPYLKAGLWKI